MDHESSDKHARFELKKLSNGQLRCLVCPSLPSLDTFEMFLVHRQGKKHQASLEEFRKKIKIAKQKKPLSYKSNRSTKSNTQPRPYISYQNRQQNFAPPSCTPTIPPEIVDQWKQYNEQMKYWRQCYSQYAQNGWKLREDGTWEQDKTVEFDSDEENFSRSESPV